MRRSMRLYAEPAPDYLLAVTYGEVESISDVFSTASDLAVTTRRRRSMSTFRAFGVLIESETSVGKELLVEYKIRLREPLGLHNISTLASRLESIPPSRHHFTSCIAALL
jgi:hypothetical protein